MLLYLLDIISELFSSNSRYYYLPDTFRKFILKQTLAFLLWLDADALKMQDFIEMLHFNNVVLFTVKNSYWTKKTSKKREASIYK